MQTVSRFLTLIVFGFWPFSLIADIQSLMEPINEKKRRALMHEPRASKGETSLKGLQTMSMPEAAKGVIREADLVCALSKVLTEKYALKGEVKLFFMQSFPSVNLKDPQWQLDLLQSPPDKVTERFTLVFRIRQGEQVIGDHTMPIRMELWQPSYVAEKAIPRGSVLDPKDFIVRDVDVLRVRGVRVPLDVALGTFIANQNIPMGDVLVVRDLRLKPVIHKDQIVDVLAQEGSLHIKMRAKAMQDGVVGDVIEVVNMTSRKSIYAQVVAENTLKIEF
jgi:flagella basal body P-ring formation protein FlgA